MFSTDTFAELESRLCLPKFDRYLSLEQRQRDLFDMLEYDIETRVEELDQKKLPLLLNNKYQSLEDEKDILGDVANIRQLFIEFQQHLYPAQAA